LIKSARPDDIAYSVVKLLAKLMKPSTPVALSPREREMPTLIVDGLTAKEMADRLDVSVHTIDTHTRHLFRKLGAHSRAAAAAHALRDRLVKTCSFSRRAIRWGSVHPHSDETGWSRPRPHTPPADPS
jgi:DNA-binding CsgD family transcriptional regulator